MIVTEVQRKLALEKADALETLLRDGTVALLEGHSKPEEGIPILERVMELLRAIGRNPEAILEQAVGLSEGRQPNGQNQA